MTRDDIWWPVGQYQENKKLPETLTQPEKPE